MKFLSVAAIATLATAVMASVANPEVEQPKAEPAVTQDDIAQTEADALKEFFKIFEAEYDENMMNPAETDAEVAQMYAELDALIATLAESPEVKECAAEFEKTAEMFQERIVALNEISEQPEVQEAALSVKEARLKLEETEACYLKMIEAKMTERFDTQSSVSVEEAK